MADRIEMAPVDEWTSNSGGPPPEWARGMLHCFERYSGPCPRNPFPANSRWGRAVNDAWLSRLFRHGDAEGER